MKLNPDGSEALLEVVREALDEFAGDFVDESLAGKLGEGAGKGEFADQRYLGALMVWEKRVGDVRTHPGPGAFVDAFGVQAASV